MAINGVSTPDCTPAVDTAESAELPLIVGVSTRAMFDLAEEDAVFRAQGVEAYARLQLERENMPLRPGTAFEVTRRLLALNQPDERLLRSQYVG